MIRSQRFFAGFAFFTALTLCTSSGLPTKTYAADEKKEEKKIELPKLPEGANPKWDFSFIEQKFTVIKGGIIGTTDNGNVYFLVELKEDMPQILQFTVNLLDKEGVKITSTFMSPDSKEPGKKGDKVRLIFDGADTRANKLSWIKTAKVEFAAR